jgi:hypothetical protein
MKRLTLVCARGISIVLAAGAFSCFTLSNLSVENTTQCTAQFCITYNAARNCCDTMMIRVACFDWPSRHTTSHAWMLSDHTMLTISQTDTCPCGPDTTILRVVGTDSMSVTKSGTKLTAYLSAASPLASQTITIGSFYEVVFRKL